MFQAADLASSDKSDADQLVWQPALTAGFSRRPWLILIDSSAIDRNPYAALGSPIFGGEPLVFQHLEALDARDRADAPWGSNGLLVFLENDWEALRPAVTGDLLLRGERLPGSLAILSALSRFQPPELTAPPLQDLRFHPADPFSDTRISAKSNHSPLPSLRTDRRRSNPARRPSTTHETCTGIAQICLNPRGQ